MTEEQYRALFQELGILANEKTGYVLRLGEVSMHLYFNNLKKSIGVHFVAELEHDHLYPGHLWKRIDSSHVKPRDQPCCGRFPTVPRPGRERRAFEELRDSWASSA